jgi:hypothetical protein
MFLQNVGKFLLDHTASHSRKQLVKLFHTFLYSTLPHPNKHEHKRACNLNN